MTKQQLQVRLDELTTELNKGQKRLHLLDQERLSVEHTLLRIDGAMQLLKELMENKHDQDNVQVKPTQPHVAAL